MGPAWQGRAAKHPTRVGCLTDPEQAALPPTAAPHSAAVLGGYLILSGLGAAGS